MSETADNKAKKAAGRITAAAIMALVVYSFVMALPSTLINEVIEAFSLEGTGEGLMLGLINIGYLASLLVVPWFQGRVRKTVLLTAACLLQSVMLSMIGAAPVFLLFGAACVLLGAGESFIDTYCSSIIIDVRKEESAKYLGYIHGIFGIGSIIAPLLIYRLLSYTDWRGIHYAIAVASLLATVCIALLLRNKGGSGAGVIVSEQKLKMKDLKEYFRRRRNIILSVSGILSAMSQAGVLSWIVRYMTLRFDSAQLGAVATSAFWLCATITRLFLSRIIKRSPMKVYSTGALLYGVFIAAGVFSGNAMVLCVAVGAAGLCGGLFIPVLVGQFAVGYEDRTSFTTSVAVFVTGIPRIAAPLLIAFVSAKGSLLSGMMIPAVTAIAAGACGLLLCVNPSNTFRTGENRE